MATDVQKKTQPKRLDTRMIHLAVVAAFILGFGHLPVFSTVTPYGMKALGCFFGHYLWLGFCGYALDGADGFCVGTFYRID